MKPRKENRRELNKRDRENTMGENPLKRRKKNKTKYRHKNRWLEEDDSYEFPKYKMEEE